MENLSYSSYPDSVTSSPRSREVDVENATWDEQQQPPTANYKVKFLCSYGGKIQPRPHDNQLTYVGGDTKILTVDRYMKFTNFIMKLSSISDCDITFKYQLPGEDLDALISVTNDEDLDHLMLEYDRLCKSSAKPARLRLFLFNIKPAANNSSFGSTESKSERQWFVDALNSANLEAVSEQQQQQPPLPPPCTAADNTRNPDYLFGLEDKGHQLRSAQQVENTPQSQTAPPLEEVVGQPVVTPAEIHRQIEELQRLQISGQDQSPRYYRGEYGNTENYQQNVSPPPPPQQSAFPVNPPAGYWPEQHIPGGQYPHPQAEQPVYLIQTPSGIYQAPGQPVRQMTGQAGQGYYGMQRMVPEVYREQQVYNPVQQQQQKYSGAYNAETMGFVRGPPESAYAQVGIDGAGRQVYYTTQGGMVAAPPVQGIAAGGGPGYMPEVKGAQPSPM